MEQTTPRVVGRSAEAVARRYAIGGVTGEQTCIAGHWAPARRHRQARSDLRYEEWLAPPCVREHPGDGLSSKAGTAHTSHYSGVAVGDEAVADSPSGLSQCGVAPAISAATSVCGDSVFSGWAHEVVAEELVEQVVVAEVQACVCGSLGERSADSRGYSKTPAQKLLAAASGKSPLGQVTGQQAAQCTIIHTNPFAALEDDSGNDEPGRPPARGLDTAMPLGRPPDTDRSCVSAESGGSTATGASSSRSTRSAGARQRKAARDLVSLAMLGVDEGMLVHHRVSGKVGWAAVVCTTPSARRLGQVCVYTDGSGGTVSWWRGSAIAPALTFDGRYVWGSDFVGDTGGTLAEALGPPAPPPDPEELSERYEALLQWLAVASPKKRAECSRAAAGSAEAAAAEEGGSSAEAAAAKFSRPAWRGGGWEGWSVGHPGFFGPGLPGFSDQALERHTSPGAGVAALWQCGSAGIAPGGSLSPGRRDLRSKQKNNEGEHAYI